MFSPNKKCPTFLLLSTIFLIFLQTEGVLGWKHSDFFPSKCENFSDTRTTKTLDERNVDNTVILIPAHLTSQGKEEIKFTLRSSDFHTDNALDHEKQCTLANQRKIHVNLTKSHNSNIAPVVPPSIILPASLEEGQEGGSARSIYFTVDGYVYENGEFYSPTDYCVLSVSDNQLLLKRCKVDCSADLSTTNLYTVSPGYSPSRICLPKCCGVDETLVSPNSLKCRKLENTESLYFRPYLRFPKLFWYLQDSEENKDKDKYSIVISSDMVSKHRISFNKTHAVPGGSRVWDRLHFYSPGAISCKKGFITEKIKWEDVLEAEGKSFRRPFRLFVAPDSVQPQYLTRSRRWVRHVEDGGQFCVDGIDKWGVDSLGYAVTQVVVMCGDPLQDSDAAEAETRIGNFTPVTVEDWVHLGFSIFATLLMLLVFLTFLGLFKTLNSQEHIILSHCGSLSALYILSTLGRLYYLTQQGNGIHNTGGNSLVGAVGKSGDIMGKEESLRIGTGCTIIAVLHHYFQFTTYFWLTIMNYDMWKRVRLLEMVGRRNLNETVMYSGFCWGVPFVFILSFVIADVTNNDPFLETTVPDYGKEYCAVASWSAGYYVHLPIFILLLLNLIFILNRMGKWCMKKCIEDGGDEFFAMSSLLQKSRRTQQCELPEEDPSFPPTLFAIIWCIHLVAWLFELAFWLKLFRNNYEFDWQYILAQYASLLIVPFLLFYLYCMNQDIVERVGKNFSALSGVSNTLQKSKFVMKKGFMTKKDKSNNVGGGATAAVGSGNIGGSNSEVDNNDDAIVIESRQSQSQQDNQ